VFVQDLTQMIAFCVQVMMYASAVFYPTTRIPPAGMAVLRFNPLLQAVDLARGRALWQQPINYRHLGYLYLVGFVACVLGHSLFRRMKPAFADVI
jgi:ABC-type polysaccharide/polyol phosphate export permease